MLESKRFASTEDWLEYRVERVHYQEKIELLELQLKKEQEESTASCGGLTFQQGCGRPVLSFCSCFFSVYMSESYRVAAAKPYRKTKQQAGGQFIMIKKQPGENF